MISFGAQHDARVADEDGVFITEDRVVLILCGLIASGKSTFAEALQEHFPQFRRCNQDDLGSRREVERVARDFLNQGYSICVDRTNFDAAQRSHWIKIAHEFPETLVWVIVFDTPYEICAERLRQRTAHPTIKSAEQGLSILARFAKDFRHPNSLEGYDRVLYLQLQHFLNAAADSDSISGSLCAGSEYPVVYYSKSEISSILHRIRSSPALLPDPASSTAPAASLSDFSFTSVSNPFGPSVPSIGWHRSGHRSPSMSSGRMASPGYSDYWGSRRQDSSSSRFSQNDLPLHDYEQSRGNWRDVSRGHSPCRGYCGGGSHSFGTQAGSYWGVPTEPATITHLAEVAGAPPDTRTDGDGHASMAQ